MKKGQYPPHLNTAEPLRSKRLAQDLIPGDPKEAHKHQHASPLIEITLFIGVNGKEGYKLEVWTAMDRQND